jgi:predicted transcriptional regulator
LLRAEVLRQRQAKLRQRIVDEAALIALDEELAQALDGLAEVRAPRRPARVRRGISIVTNAVAQEQSEKEPATDDSERTF